MCTPDLQKGVNVKQISYAVCLEVLCKNDYFHKSLINTLNDGKPDAAASENNEKGPLNQLCLMAELAKNLALLLHMQVAR